MLFGSWMAYYDFRKKGIKRKLLGLYVLIFGIPELHGHIRFRALKKHFRSLKHNVEVGCGGGAMSGNFALHTRKPILGLAYTKGNSMKESVKCAGLDNLVKCGREDALKLNSIGNNWDQVLLLDVLEHVKGSDLKVLKNINGILRMEGYLILSVPTPLYTKCFGEKFDKWAWDNPRNEITHHLRHYTLDMLENSLAQAGFKIIDWEYNTNPFTAYLCTIWYKYFLEHKFLRYLSLPILNAFSIFDLLSPLKKKRNSLKSCEIILTAIKKNKALN